MKLSPQDLAKLRPALIALGVVLVLAAAFVAYAEDRLKGVKQDLMAKTSQLNQAKQRYQTSGMEKEMIIKYLPEYQRLIKDGFIGEERRIEWVDNLRTMHKTHKLFNINYSIGAQESYKPTFLPDTGMYALHRSVMKLDLNMLHEGDLVTVLDGLKATQSSTFIVRDCELSRQSQVSLETLSPNMLAKCELDWFTLHEPQKVPLPAP